MVICDVSLAHIDRIDREKVRSLKNRRLLGGTEAIRMKYTWLNLKSEQEEDILQEMDPELKVIFRLITERILEMESKKLIHILDLMLVENFYNNNNN